MREKSEAAARTRARRRSRGGLNDFTFCGLCFSDACTHTHTRACALHTKTLFHIILPLPPQHAHSFEAFAACRGYFSARIKPAPPLWRAPFSVSLAPARAPAFHGRGGGGGIPPPPPPPLCCGRRRRQAANLPTTTFFLRTCLALLSLTPAHLLPCFCLASFSTRACARTHQQCAPARVLSPTRSLSLSLSLPTANAMHTHTGEWGVRRAHGKSAPLSSRTSDVTTVFDAKVAHQLSSQRQQQHSSGKCATQQQQQALSLTHSGVTRAGRPSTGTLDG